MKYSREIMDKTILKISTRKQAAEMKANEHKTEIYIKIPEIKEIDRELSSMSISVAKAILSKNADIDTLIEGLRQRNISLQRKKAELLKQHNYPDDYLREQHFCKICNDQGYIDGKRCSCFNAELKVAAFEQLNQVSPLKICDFKSFNLEYYPETSESGGLPPRLRMTQIYKSCIAYAKNFTPNSPSILMTGNTGLGKTHLSLAIAGEVISKGYGVIYNSCQNIMSKIENEYFSRSDDEKENFLNAVTQCDLLILDDLGVEFSSNFSNSMLYNIINTRSNMSLPTIISTNLTSEELLKRYADRIVSRIIAGYEIFIFQGKDIRQLKMHQKFKGK